MVGGLEFLQSSEWFRLHGRQDTWKSKAKWLENLHYKYCIAFEIILFQGRKLGSGGFLLAGPADIPLQKTSQTPRIQKEQTQIANDEENFELDLIWLFTFIC